MSAYVSVLKNLHIIIDIWIIIHDAYWCKQLNLLPKYMYRSVIDKLIIYSDTEESEPTPEGLLYIQFFISFSLGEHLAR